MPPKKIRVELTDMERSVTNIALEHYAAEIKREAQLRRNDPGYHISTAAATLVEINAVQSKLI